MGDERTLLPPPTGAPADAPLVPAPPAPPRLGVQHRGQGAQVGATASRRDTPLVAVVHQRRSHGWSKVVVSWLVLVAAVVAVVIVYPRVKEQLTLDDARVTEAADGFRVQDGVVSFRIPARPHKILVHPAGEAKGITGFRITIDSSTLEVDVKNTASARTPTALQRFCDAQFGRRTSTLGPAIDDRSSFDNGIYQRTATWHKGEQFVLATCLGHSHSNVLVEATTMHDRWAPYAQAVETIDFAS